MSRYGFDVLQFKITSTSATGAFHDIGPYITEYSGLNNEAMTQEAHAMGDNWVKHAFTGLRQTQPFTIRGFYDDVAASGPHALLGNATDLGAERCIKLNLGTTNAYPKLDVIVKRYNRQPVRGELTAYEAEFVPASSYTVVAT